MLKSRNVTAPVRARGDQFVTRVATRICEEIPSDRNPYVARRIRCHGYDLMELAENRSVEDVVFLLFSGELPTREQARLLRILMIALINPGPRHPATRAGMLAAVSKTDPSHLLPISASVMSGDYLGAGEAMSAALFLRKHLRCPAVQVAERCMGAEPRQGPETADRVAPGFGKRFGSVDEVPQTLANRLLREPGSGRALAWGAEFARTIGREGHGWLVPGVVAAATVDLGMPPRSVPGIYQWLAAPGMLAHAVELSGKPITAMPFVKNEDYVVEAGNQG